MKHNFLVGQMSLWIDEDNEMDFFNADMLTAL